MSELILFDSLIVSMLIDPIPLYSYGNLTN